MAASEHQKCRSWTEAQAPLIPVSASTESDSSAQLVGDTPQPSARIGSGEEAGRAWMATHPTPASSEVSLPRPKPLWEEVGVHPHPHLREGGQL